MKLCGHNTKARKHCRDSAICDFCIHFNMYKNKLGGNIDGNGNCGLHRKTVEACDMCQNYYCFGRR